MRIHIIGAGEVGRHMALSLSDQGHDITLIEQDEDLAAEVDAQLDGRVLAADGCSVAQLVESGAAESELFLALTSHNNTNLVSCSIAKHLGAQKVICRVHPSLQRDEWMFDYRGHFALDYIFSSERLSAVELAKYIRNPTSLVVEEIARGKIELQQVTVSKESEAAGLTLRELNLPARVRVAAVTRNGISFVPTADSKLASGDRLTVFGDATRLHNVLPRLQKDCVAPASLRVVIFGGGEYGLSLATMLESWNCRVRIFEKDKAVCDELIERLSSATVLNADATSINVLREEQVGDADFFVAVSPSDEDNVMSCLQARNIGAEHCLTLIHRADYADAIRAYGEHFGIMGAVSPREATRLDLTRFVTEDRYHVYKKLEEGEIIEMSVPSKSAVSGLKVSEISWPEGTVVVAIIHGSRALVPGPDDRVEEGDTLYAMVSPDSRRKFVKLVSKKG